MRSGIVRQAIPIYRIALLFSAMSLLGGCSIAATEPAFFDSATLFTGEDQPGPTADSRPSRPSTPSIANEPAQAPSLFSADYVKSVGRDIALTFTAPSRWDQGDWLV